MLEFDLHRLEREGKLRLHAAVSQDDPLWNDSGLSFAASLDVDLEAATMAGGGVWVRGTFAGALGQECRRCLKPVEVPIREEVALLFRPEEEIDEDHDGEIRPLEGDGNVLDLSKSIREEVILAAPPYGVCDPECKGLCPTCGTNLNEDTCECAGDDPDPRWDALRAQNNE